MYKIETPNKKYSGVTEGVAFADGIGRTDCENTRNVLVNDYGYKDVTNLKELEEEARRLGREVKANSSNIIDLTVDQLKEIAKDLKLTNYSKLTKKELIELIESASKDKTKTDA